MNRSKNLVIRSKSERGKERIYVSLDNETARFTKFRKGIYTFGKQEPLDFIHGNKLFLSSVGLTDSEINTMIAVSKNEGNFDAVNTWDNSFMTFGMFQWTVGTGERQGELPALLKRIKDGSEKIFKKYFGDYDLDIVDTSAIIGSFVLNGKKLNSPYEKEQLRTYEWAFHFWRSGQNPLIQSFQIEHALSRVNVFYKSNAYKIRDYYISDLITSEYGVALILDNHVNRPGYIKPCLKETLDAVRLPDPSSWSTDEERKFIKKYLEIRETYGAYPMTHAKKRALSIKKFIDNKTISDERGSFIK